MPSGSGPPPERLQAFLRQRRPAIIGSLLADGSPSTVATWYLWLGGARLMLSTNKGGFRERNLARDGRVALTVLGEDWYHHVSLRGRVVQMRADPDWADLDALSQHYRGVPYPREAGFTRWTVIVEVDRWLEFQSTSG
jgi:PPOX class probable F420-dependent enzyme